MCFQQISAFRSYKLLCLCQTFKAKAPASNQPSILTIPKAHRVIDRPNSKACSHAIKIIVSEFTVLLLANRTLHFQPVFIKCGPLFAKLSGLPRQSGLLPLVSYDVFNRKDLLVDTQITQMLYSIFLFYEWIQKL